MYRGRAHHSAGLEPRARKPVPVGSIGFPACLLYAFHSIARRTNVRTGRPDGPSAINGLLSSSHAVPAISRCTQGVGSANSFKNIAAVTAPPQRPPTFARSAKALFKYSL